MDGKRILIVNDVASPPAALCACWERWRPKSTGTVELLCRFGGGDAAKRTGILPWSRCRSSCITMKRKLRLVRSRFCRG